MYDLTLVPQIRYADGFQNCYGFHELRDRDAAYDVVIGDGFDAVDSGAGTASR